MPLIVVDLPAPWGLRNPKDLPLRLSGGQCLAEEGQEPGQAGDLGGRLGEPEGQGFPRLFSLLQVRQDCRALRAQGPVGAFAFPRGDQALLGRGRKPGVGRQEVLRPTGSSWPRAQARTASTPAKPSGPCPGRRTMEVRSWT